MKYTKIVKLNSKDAVLVKALKEQLNKRIGTTLDVNNPTFGPTTQEAVKKFQRQYQLLDDGVVGKLTWDTLFSNVTELPSTGVSAIALKAIEFAKTQTHVREKTGKNDGVEVEAYLKAVGLGKGFPYCQAFVYYCFNRAANELLMNNPLPKTGGVLNHYNLTNGKKVTIPQAGDITVMDFGKGQGHTGIVISVDGSYVIVVEGNTSPSPTDAKTDREGQGVYIRRRKISSINKGFIRY